MWYGPAPLLPQPSLLLIWTWRLFTQARRPLGEHLHSHGIHWTHRRQTISSQPANLPWDSSQEPTRATLVFPQLAAERIMNWAESNLLASKGYHTVRWLWCSALWYLLLEMQSHATPLLCPMASFRPTINVDLGVPVKILLERKILSFLTHPGL